MIESATYRSHSSSSRAVLVRPFFAFALAITLTVSVGFLFAATAAPSAAQAASTAYAASSAYAAEQGESNEASQTDVQAEITPAGDLLVSESVVCDFAEPADCMVLNIGGLPKEASYRVTGVSVYREEGADNQDGQGSRNGQGGQSGLDGQSDPGSQGGQGDRNAQEAQPVTFNVDWRESLPEGEDAPGQDVPAYSFDTVQNKLYVFAPFEGVCRIAVAYEADQAVQHYADSSELTWHVKGVGDGATDNLTVTVKIPVTQGDLFKAGVNVFAWVHGPEGSSVSIDDADTVTFQCPEVHEGQFAEVRILFPDEWLSAVDREADNQHRDIWHWEQALEDEHVWTNDSRRWAAGDALHDAVAYAFGLVLLGWAVVSFARFSRSKPKSHDGNGSKAVEGQRDNGSKAAEPLPASGSPAAGVQQAADEASSRSGETYWSALKFRIVGVAAIALVAAVVASYVMGKWLSVFIVIVAIVAISVAAHFVRRK